jgi:aerobic carbon-monoxide dehydrogenase medium subunit
MIPFEFEYYRPDSLRQAIEIYQDLQLQGKETLYYNGGTEIITLSRINLLYTDAVIDIKNIPECNVVRFHNHQLEMGAGLSLTRLVEAGVFPLFSKTASGIANHTARSKITLGGNINGQIFYRESVLPFLLSDANALIAGGQGIRMEPINQIFDREMRLQKSEFLVQMRVDERYIHMPHLHMRRTRNGKTGYPLLTIAAVKVEDEIRVAFSGVCDFPFRSRNMEQVLNYRGVSIQERVDESFKYLPAPILNDMEGSDEYRVFVMKHFLIDILERLEGISV